VYLALDARVTVGFQKRLADVRAAERYEKELAVHSAVEMEVERLATHLLPMKPFRKVDKFLNHFDGDPLDRRPILAIVGGTNLGKSLLAAAVLRKLGKKLALTKFLEVTVEGNNSLDLSAFIHSRDAGVLLDGVGDTFTLWTNREILQGKPKVVKGGQSATMVYSYSYTLFNRGVVAAFDLSAKNLHACQTDHWLSDEKNVIFWHSTEKAFQESLGHIELLPEVPTETLPLPVCRNAWTEVATETVPLPMRRAASTEVPDEMGPLPVHRNAWTGSPLAKRAR
jgi:hypothetical protein